jgi:ABC-2 type transport system permease protein
MALHAALAALAFRRQFTYRAAHLAGFATNLFWGLLRVAVVVAFYGQSREAAGIPLTAAITFTGLTQGLIVFLSLFAWDPVALSVQSGEIGADLLRPLDYLAFWLAQDAGRAAAGLLIRGVPIMLLYALLFELAGPANPGQWTAFGAALALAWLTSFGWRFLANLSAFWTENALGVLRFAFGLAHLLSGFVLPLRFYPQWFQQLAHLTPFPAMVTTPVEIYLGLMDGPAIARALLVQALWAVALLGLARLVLAAGVRRLVVQGG